jgi:uncharacterized integral membrane protein (TIGR00697 family)
MKRSTAGVRLDEFRYFTLLGGLFVATSLIANTVAQKPWQLSRFVLPAGSIVFPISYIFGDVLTEVYGYARTRQVIWTGLVANVLMVGSYWLAIELPPSSFWPYQESFTLILAQVPRIVLASLVGYLLGEFTNSFVLAKIKIYTEGRHLWIRTTASTVTGQAVDTGGFVAIAYFAKWPTASVVMAGFSLYAFKVLYEVLATPITYAVVAFLKRAENIDHYDAGTDFSPFRWMGDSQRR